MPIKVHVVLKKPFDDEDIEFVREALSMTGVNLVNARKFGILVGEVKDEEALAVGRNLQEVQSISTVTV